MAIAFVRSTGKIRATSNPDSVAGSFSSLPSTANDIVVSAVAADNDSALDLGTGACTDNQGHTYARAVRSPVIEGSPAFYETSAIYHTACNTSSGTFTVTINPAGTGSFGAIVFVGCEYSGMETSTPLDKTNSTNSTDTDPFIALSSSTGTLTQADELVVAVTVFTRSNGPVVLTSITVDSGFTERAEELDNDTYQSCEMDDLIVSATTAIEAGWTIDNGTSQGSLIYSGCIATFKAAAAALARDQEGFRFRADDGSETTATWLDAQDTDITRAKGTNTRPRILTNITNDPPSEALKLQYRKVGATDWHDLGE